MDRTAELRGLYDSLKEKLENAMGSGAAAVVRELRILAADLERLEAQEMSKADELAARRKTKPSAPRPASRRREPRRGAARD
jgi:hypothetical protein